MLSQTKNRFRPIYKPLLNLNENIQNKNKLLKFKKKKWQKLIFIYKKKLNLYKKIKPKDQIQCVIARYPSKTFSYQKQFKIKLIETKKFKLAYGGLLNKTLEILFKKNVFQRPYSNSMQSNAVAASNSNSNSNSNISINSRNH